MSLATRCNACGTVFRVVQDQLKVSEGWVRCGRCGEVFNALEGLFDLEGNSGPVPLAREPVASPPPPPQSSSPMAFDPFPAFAPASLCPADASRNAPSSNAVAAPEVRGSRSLLSPRAWRRRMPRIHEKTSTTSPAHSGHR